MDTDSIRMVYCPVCGGLMAEGKPCRACTLSDSAAPSVSIGTGRAASAPAARTRSWPWLVAGAIAVLAASIIAAVVITSRGDDDAVVSYEDAFGTVTMSYATASRELVPVLNDFGNWSTPDLVRMRALVGILANTNTQARALRPPLEATDAHAALIEAVYNYDLASQQVLAFVHAAGAAGGFPDPRGALDASRSLIKADKARIQAQATYVKVYGHGVGDQ